MNGMPKFNLPNSVQDYINTVFQRCISLIQTRVWEGMDANRLRRWFHQFDSSELLYMAACLLDGLVYRSEQQTIALIEQLLQRVLPAEYAAIAPSDTKLSNDWTGVLRQAPGPPLKGVRILPVIREGDRPHKSGAIILRMMSRKLQVAPGYFLNASEVEAALKVGTKHILCVDDILGSGDQFVSFWKDAGLDAAAPNTKVCYAPLVAHEQGIAKIRKHCKGVSVACVERLGPPHSVFSSQSSSFDDECNDPSDALRYYLEFTRGFGIPDPIARGHRDMQLSYVFEHAVPDNNLGVFWYDDGDDFRPLFKR